MPKYIAPGLREFRLLVPANGTSITVDFTGGRWCGYSQRPASFATDDPVISYLIENSPEYRSGRIAKSLEDEY